MDDVVLLSRIQFAINIAFHFIYPPLSIGIGLMLVVMEGLYLKTKRAKFRDMTKFWAKIFGLTFALGVATGLVQTFAFGTNWGRYSRFVGDVFGSALAAEGIFAFFLEAGFLGVLLFGWNRVGPKVHYFSTVMVALGAHFSAVWIIVANSWMQTPSSFRIEGTGEQARAVITDFWGMVFNPSSIDRIVHVVLGCWISGAFIVISVAAFYLLRKRYVEISSTMMKIGLTVAGGALLLQLVSGDSSARLLVKYQPAKLAAFEGNYRTRPYTPFSIYGWVDAKNEKVYSIKIPSGLSLLAYRNPETPVAGLDQFPRDQWPNVPVVFQTYHIMIACWFLMAIIVIVGLIKWKRKKLHKMGWFQWVMVFSVVLPQVALQAGWFSAELGRQPWVVYNILRTADGVSRGLSTSQIIGSIVMFVLIYLLLIALFLFLLDRKIKHGPEEEKPEDAAVYRDMYSTFSEE